MITPDEIKAITDGKIDVDRGLEIDLLDLSEEEKDGLRQAIELYEKLYEILPDYVGQLTPLEIECVEQNSKKG